MVNPQTAEYFREMDKRRPRVHFRLPDPETLADLESVAVANSTTKSGFIRNVVLQAIAEEKAKQTA